MPSGTVTAQAPAEECRRDGFFDVIGASLAINTPEQFCAWTQGDLQKILPHGMLACGMGMVENNSGHIEHIITCNFPSEYLQRLQEAGGLGDSPIVAQWAQTRRPVLFEMSDEHVKSAWLENFQRYGLNNVAAHGLCDLNSLATSYFSFSQIPGKLTSRHAQLLEMLVPHLHVALTRVVGSVQQESRLPKSMPHGLTEREAEIMKWLGAGKTNWEIAQVLRISENTVKNHVQRILAKLKVSTRAQAVAKVVSSDECITGVSPFNVTFAASTSKLRVLVPLLLACSWWQYIADVITAA